MDNGTLSIIWAVLIVLFTIVEALTLGLTSIWFAVGSLAALIASALGLNIVIQILSFIIVSAILIIYTRPVAKKVLKIGQNKTNVDALIGRKGYVIKAIQPREIGQVKLGGQVWTAKGEDHVTYEVDEEVEVLAIEGVKLIIKKVV
ncbi:MAG TPA: NfeD family protein [Clostridiales bacterium UBA8960]|jgi:membrane protein implicated in regulation of membrane protease activity|nr:NfeD family protein [Clostridiales bacterium UBA8960]